MRPNIAESEWLKEKLQFDNAVYISFHKISSKTKIIKNLPDCVGLITWLQGKNLQTVYI